MVFKLNAPLYSVEVDRKEGENIMYINYLTADFVPSIADSGEVMGKVIDGLGENSNVSRVVFVQQRNYNYPFEQVSLLGEISRIYNYLLKQEKILSPEKLKFIANVSFAYNELSYLMNLLRTDPVGFYLSLGKRIEEYKRDLSAGSAGGAGIGGNEKRLSNYTRFLERIREIIANTGLIKLVIDVVDNYSVGDREVYRAIFRPDVLPNFSFTRLVAQIPEDAELVDEYNLEGEFEDINVSILKKKNDSRFIYHIMPEEYSLGEEHHMLLNLGRSVMIEHQPKAEEFTDPDKTRAIFFNVARDLIEELSQSKGIALTYRELQKLAKILVRQTIGFGLIEVLLMDERIQDINLNSPISQNPIFIRHEKYGDCVTNILPSYEDADSWAAKLRLQSGRPLDEANPILDSDLVFGGIRARVAAIQRPLSNGGIAYALRRHRDEPWTLPLLIEKGMMNSFAAGLLSFFIDGARTMLIAGTRSSGKTSLLGSLMLEIMPQTRVIVVEDTLELPIDALRKLGYNVQSLKVRSALLETTTEVAASEGIRTSLRLGDSGLIIGEVRSDEAKALYEAMRVGALANVVAGTIHGASPYAVFDRVVNDLNVPITSFKATDLIVVANPIKSADGLHSRKRIIQISEVRKHWTKDPELERGFVDLMRYNVEKDELEPTEELINGDSEIIKAIASNVRGWAGNWDAIFDNIILRGKVKQEIVEISRKLNRPELMEAKFTTKANDAFHRISERVAREKGLPVSELVFPEWKKWLVENAGR